MVGVPGAAIPGSSVCIEAAEDARILVGLRGPMGCRATAEARLLVLEVACLKVEVEFDSDECMYGELPAVRELPRAGDRTPSSGTSLRLPVLGDSTPELELGIMVYPKSSKNPG